MESGYSDSATASTSPSGATAIPFTEEVPTSSPIREVTDGMMPGRRPP
jgi:hypothetical protein